MSSKAIIDDFLKQKHIAVVGVSRTGKKFSNRVYKDLKSKGYQVYQVNPSTDEIDGVLCFRDLKSVPKPVDGVVVVVPPEQTEKVVREAAEAGIKRVWMQQGAESQVAIEFCEAKGIQVVHHKCIMMFAEPAALPHKVHRCAWKMLGKLPK